MTNLPLHQIARPPDPGPADPAAEIPAADRYGYLRIAYPQPVVEEAPAHVLIALSMFTRPGLTLYGDLVCVGSDAAGQRVWYRITGWDADQRALVAVRRARPVPLLDES